MRISWFAMPVILALALLSAWLMLADSPPKPRNVPHMQHEYLAFVPPAPVALRSSDNHPAPASAELLETATEEEPAAPAEEPPEPATAWHDESYSSGARKASFEAYTEQLASFTGVIESVSAASGSSLAIVRVVSGEGPKPRTEFRVIDSRGNHICHSEVVRLFHKNDDPQLPIIELTCRVFERRDRPACKGESVIGFASRVVKHDRFVAWYEDGTMAALGKHTHGKRGGEWSYWHRNGALRAVGHFEEDLPKGDWTFWREDGSRWAVWTGDSEGVMPWTIWTANGTPDPFCDTKTLSLIESATYFLNTTTLAISALPSARKAKERVRNLPQSERRDELHKFVESLVAELEARLEWANTQGKSGSVDGELGLIARHLANHGPDERPVMPPEVFAPDPHEELSTHWMPTKARDPFDYCHQDP